MYLKMCLYHQQRETVLHGFGVRLESLSVVVCGQMYHNATAHLRELFTNVPCPTNINPPSNNMLFRLWWSERSVERQVMPRKLEMTTPVHVPGMSTRAGSWRNIRGFMPNSAWWQWLDLEKSVKIKSILIILKRCWSLEPKWTTKIQCHSNCVPWIPIWTNLICCAYEELQFLQASCAMT